MRGEQSAKVIELESFRKRRAERELATTTAPSPRPTSIVWLVPMATVAPMVPGWGYWLWPRG